MAETIINPSLVEVEPLRSAGRFESRKSRLLARAAVVAGVLVVAATLGASRSASAELSPRMPEVGVLDPQLLTHDLALAPQPPPKNQRTAQGTYESPPMKYVGFFAPEMFTTDKNKALTVARLAKEAGATTMIVSVNYTQTEHGDIQNDAPSFCTAAWAAQTEGLGFGYRYIGYYAYPKGQSSKPEIGFVPSDHTEITQFITTNNAFMELSSGSERPVEHPDPHKAYRCDQLKEPFRQLTVIPFVEWNYPTLVKDQDNAPANEVHLLERFYPATKKTARQLGIQANVWAGGLTPARDVLGYITKFGEVIKTENVKLPIFDAWGDNPYNPGGLPTDVHPNGGTIGLADTQLLSQQLDQVLGYTPKIVVEEYAVESQTPTTEIPDLYDPGVQDGSSPVDYATQAQEYQTAFGLAACTPNIIGFFVMHTEDDKAVDSWGRGGFYQSDGSNKPNTAANQHTMQKAANGGLTTCPAPSK
jgi:hypothetical protein